MLQESTTSKIVSRFQGLMQNKYNMPAQFYEGHVQENSNLDDHSSMFLCGVKSFKMKHRHIMLCLLEVHAKLNPQKTKRKSF
jgi:hypothetical protein